jgi:hypothetical protein
MMTTEARVREMALSGWRVGGARSPGARADEHGFVDVTPSYKGHRFPVEIISYCVWLVRK